MIHKQPCNVYIASCTLEGGIYHYHLSDDGTLKFVDMVEVDRPMYLAANKKHLYAILRAPFKDSNESGLTSFEIGNEGRLSGKTQVQSTKGEVACHLCSGDDIYCVNYISGSLIKMPDILVTHTGESIHPTRQNSPHTHQVIFTPDGKYICVTDLGVDKVFVYDKDLNFVSYANVPVGHGPRHMVFAPKGDYTYCANELASTVTVFRYHDGMLEAENTYYALPEDFKGESAIAAIRISSNGKYLYVSNRGHDSISCFKSEGSKLILFDVLSSGGSSPRDFNITPNEEFLLCANENSNNVKVFKINDGKLIPKDFEVELSKPLCIIFEKGVK